MASQREPLTALDGVAVVLALGATLAVALMLPVAQSFHGMYADLGTEHAQLPWLTRAVTLPLAPLVLALAPSAALVVGWRAHALGARRIAVVVAFTLALIALALCCVGFYLPIWQIADSVAS